MNEGMQNATAGWHNSSDHVKNMLHVIVTKNMEINELIQSVMNVIYQINSQTDVVINESEIAHDDGKKIQIENVQIQEVSNNIQHPFLDESIEISKITDRDSSNIIFTDGNCENGLVNTSENTNSQIEDAMPTADKMEDNFPHNAKFVVEEYENPPIIDSKPFQCSECDKAFSKKESLKRHIAIHGDDMFQCDQCEFQTVWDRSLKSHTMTMHTDKQYKCDKDNCDFRAPNQLKISRHIESEHEGVRYECNLCSYKGRLKSDLKRHIGAMHEGITYDCTQCPKTYKEKRKLKEHVQFAHQGFIQKCDQCDYQSGRKINLYRHVQTKHRGIKKPPTIVQCEQCRKPFSGIGNLKFHIKTIHGGIKYQCDICGHQASTKYNLIKHKNSKGIRSCAGSKWAGSKWNGHKNKT